jgi:hypothetical protein
VEELMPAAVIVLPDEKAYGLSEVNLLGPFVEGEGQTMRRYQIIYVNRDDKLAEYREDLGLASEFDAILFRVPSFWEHTVGELMDIAQDLRNRPPSFTHGIIPHQGEEHKKEFWKRYLDLQEAMRRKERTY